MYFANLFSVPTLFSSSSTFILKASQQFLFRFQVSNYKMTGKNQNKKELQVENNQIKKELSDVKNHYAHLLEEYRSLEAKSTVSFKCSKCENNLESFKVWKTPQENHSRVKDLFKCDHCEKDFNKEWKLNAHLKSCKVNKCDVCGQTFKYTDLLK